MTAPTLPIIVDNYGDVLVFKSVADALVYLEPIDVQNNEYVAFDAEGRVLQLEATHDEVCISLPERPAYRAADLERVLRTFLIAINDPNGNNRALDLPALVKYCEKFAYTPSSMSSFFSDGWKALVSLFVKRGTDG